jgi:nitrogen fixation NifU-like protein
VEGYNPLCGDQVGVSVTIENGFFTELNCFGQGCAISKASASVLTTLLKGQPVSRFYEIFATLQGVFKGDGAAIAKLEAMGDVAALEGVRKFPARIKCATLAWQALRSALEQGKDGQFTI